MKYCSILINYVPFMTTHFELSYLTDQMYNDLILLKRETNVKASMKQALEWP